jgi:hypothetical protein
MVSLAARGDWVAAGGTVSNYPLNGTNYTVHIFTSSGPFAVNSNLSCDVLLVAGGGGGGETIGGGGGGGGVLASNAFNVVTGNYTVTVGSGGAGGWDGGGTYPAGAKGGNSLFSTLTAIGGGAGAGFNVNAVGTGGSAGGNGGGAGARAGYTTGQGNDGGPGSASNAGGGGGGAAQTGAAAAGSPVNGGKGGDGITNSLSGTPTVYAGGGGGGTRTGYGAAGSGGLGGGGAGGTGGNPGTNGMASTGGGGGGGGFTSDMPGGSGGSGIVMVRYIQVPVTMTVPAVTNLGATNAAFSTATLQGRVTDVGGDIPSAWFQYWVDGGATTSTVAMGLQVGTFTKWITGLSKGSAYQYRILASNAVGSVWSEPMTFLTGEGNAYYVATNGSGVGTNWATAFPSIQTALDTATNGEFVYIKGGAYAITNQLVWTSSGVTILGAYEGTNAAGPGDWDLARWPSVLARPSSAGQTRILSVIGVNGGTLSRLTLTNGYLNAPVGAAGGGVSVVGASGLTLSSLTVAGGTIVVDSYAPALGVGLSIVNSTNVTLADSTIRDNKGTCYAAFLGSGIYASNTTLTITNCVIRNNEGGYYIPTGADQGVWGGGLCLKNCRATVADTTVAGNFSRGHYQFTTFLGAGVYVDGGTNAFRNCLIAGNNCRINTHNGSLAYGDGVYLLKGVSTFANCTVIRNNGQGIYYKGGSVTVTNSILWDNLDDLANFPTNSQGALTNVWTSCIEDGDNSGTNACLSADPRFERGLYLGTNSPCVDAGGTPAPDAGLANRTTRADGAPDAGAVDLGYHFAGGILDSPVGDLYVAPSGADANAGTNESGAFRSITKALSVAAHGSRIHVAAGLYTNIIESFPLTIDKFGLELLGANASATVVRPPSGQRALFITGVGYVRLQGVTLTGGSVSANIPGLGLGIINSRLTMASCIISSNVLYNSLGAGAGIWAKDSFLTMTNSLLAGNTINYAGYRPSLWMGYGGGLCVEGGELTLLDSQVMGNFTAAGQAGAGSIAAGGGVALVGNYGGNRHTISNCTFTGNSIACLNNSRGAALYLAATALVANCVFATNWIVDGSKLGAGVFVGYDSGTAPPSGDIGVAGADRATLVNCTVAGNWPEGVRQNTTNDILAIRNSILWNNGDDLASSNMTATLGNLWYSDIEDGDNATTNGCFSADPLFANATNDWHLKSHGGRWTPGDVWVKDPVTSPCIDAGDPAADYSREPEPNGRRINLGAYGNTRQASKKALMTGSVITIR